MRLPRSSKLRAFAGTAVQAYINTNTPLAIYGEVLGQDRIYNLLYSMLRIDAVSESQCLVAVQPTTWGDAKRLYR